MGMHLRLKFALWLMGFMPLPIVGCVPPEPRPGPESTWLLLRYSENAAVMNRAVQADMPPPCVCLRCSMPVEFPPWVKSQFTAEAVRWHYVREWVQGRRPLPGPKADETGRPWPPSTQRDRDWQ